LSREAANTWDEFIDIHRGSISMYFAVRQIIQTWQQKLQITSQSFF